jgi:hypothetical protein
MLRTAISLFAGALALAAARPATAVVLEAGVIETSGDVATVDLWYFSFAGIAPAVFGVNLTPINGPFTTEDMGLLVYTNVGGLPGALIGSDGIAGLLPRSARVDFAALAPGDYIAVVSASTLSPGEFGPTQSDPAVSVPITYEIVLDEAGSSDASYTCSIQGTLGGTFVVDADPGADCIVPTTQVPAPGSLALLLAGIAGAVGLGARRRA